MNPRDGLEYIPDPLGRVGQGEWRPRENRDPLGRLPAARPIDFASPFELIDAVGRGRPNRRDDVAKLEGLLALADRNRALLRSGPTGAFDDALEQATKAHQARRRLAVDGWAAPGGETIRSLQAAARERIAPARSDAGAVAPVDPSEWEDPSYRIDSFPPDPWWQDFLRAVARFFRVKERPPIAVSPGKTKRG